MFLYLVHWLRHKIESRCLFVAALKAIIRGHLLVPFRRKRVDRKWTPRLFHALENRCRELILRRTHQVPGRLVRRILQALNVVHHCGRFCGRSDCRTEQQGVTVRVKPEKQAPRPPLEGN